MWKLKDLAVKFGGLINFWTADWLLVIDYFGLGSNRRFCSQQDCRAVASEFSAAASVIFVPLRLY